MYRKAVSVLTAIVLSCCAEELAREKKSYRFLVLLTGDIFLVCVLSSIDATKPGPIGRLINHGSKNANLQSKVVVVCTISSDVLFW